MLSVGSAVALVRDSPLLDVEWYAALVGAEFGTREEAAEHWVTRRSDDASPHPLFEPAWLYPGGRWRRDAPDPLSFYLSRSAWGRSPHPRYPQGELGPLEQWLAEHDPSELLPEALPRAPITDVTVLVPGDDLALAVRWVRHLDHHSPHLTAVVTPSDAAARRVLLSVAATKPSVIVGDAPSSSITVTIDSGLRPPGWGWIDPLVDALQPGVAAAQPVLLRDDFTVASPVLVGLPLQDAERMAKLPLPDVVPGVVARRVGATGTTVLVPTSRLMGPDHDVSDDATWQPLWEAAGFSAPRSPFTVREGAPALRWSIDIPAGAGPIGRRWGDWHFARSLADALERRGQWVAIDHPETRERPSRDLDDVVLTLRGLHRVDPPAHTTNLLWVIYDPDQVSAEECARYDAVFAAGTTWAARRSAEWSTPITPLLQCTDTTRFHPGLAEPADDGALFVGNARGGMRPAVAAALEASIDLTVIGFGWDQWLPTEHAHIEATGIANEHLPARYAAAGVVLNDHHPAMRADGFVSNRVFDVLAVGGRLLSDDVPGLMEVVGLDLPTWSTADDLARLARPPFDAFPDATARGALAEHVVAEHSFDARAATLLEAVASLHSRR
ncbi:MAG: glycosyltransferase [Nocardioides sp.]